MAGLISRRAPFAAGIASACVLCSFSSPARAQSRAADPWHQAGQTALDQGDLNEALKQWSAELTAAAQSGSADRLAGAQRDLASIYTLRWQFLEAGASLDSIPAAPDGSDPALAIQADLVSAAYEEATSDLAAAARHLQDALKLARAAYGDDHPKAATVYSLLGLVELEQEHYSPSSDDLKRAVGIFNETYGPDYVESAVARNRYARLLLALGRYNDALQQASQSVNSARKLGPGARPALSEALLTRGEINLTAHRFQDAQANLQESLSLTKDVFGTPLRTLPCLDALAELALERGQAGAAQAGSLVDQALQIYASNPPADWLPGAALLRIAALAASQNQKPQDAPGYLDRAAKIAEARLGTGSLLEARILETRGGIELAAGQSTAAAGDYKSALDERQRLLTRGHPDLERSIVEIAQASGLPSVAIDSLYQDAIANIGAQSGNDSLSLIPTLQRYASFLRQQKRDQDAANVDKRVESILARPQ